MCGKDVSSRPDISRCARSSWIGSFNCWKECGFHSMIWSSPLFWDGEQYFLPARFERQRLSSSSGSLPYDLNLNFIAIFLDIHLAPPPRPVALLHELFPV
ncbi:hypothetical protein FRC12_013970 [Ceratobasidium sp. 428]|nr:hypothetical protein FRC12_013970 [Ceratobasidium sp. 428]